MRPIERLYHLAEADNLPSILQHGLMSTESLLGLVGIPEAERATLLRHHRPDSFRLSKSVLIRDQRPMPPLALARALVDGLEEGVQHQVLLGSEFVIDHGAVADVAGARTAGGIGGASGKGEFTGRGADELPGNSEKRGLAGAVAAGEDGAFTRGDFEGDAAEGEEPAIAFIDALEAEAGWR